MTRMKRSTTSAFLAAKSADVNQHDCMKCAPSGLDGSPMMRSFGSDFAVSKNGCTTIAASMRPVATAALAWLIGISVSLIVDESPPCASVHARDASEKKSLSADTPTVLPLRSAPVLIGPSARTIKPITGGNEPSYSPPGAIQINGRPRECAVHSDVTLDLAI